MGWFEKKKIPQCCICPAQIPRIRHHNWIPCISWDDDGTHYTRELICDDCAQACQSRERKPNAAKENRATD